MRMLLAAILLTAPPPQDEPKKARIVELLKKIDQEEKAAGDDQARQAAARRRLAPVFQEAMKLAAEVAGPDRAKQGALIEELMATHFPEKMAAEALKSNERNTGAGLMMLATGQAQFRAEDPDGDRKPNYWVADVSGLFRLLKKDGKAVDYVDQDIARADARPALPLDAEGESPKAPGLKLAKTGAPQVKAGYLFAAIEGYESGGKTTPYDAGGGRHPSKFGICAYPAEYGRTGTLTFIKNEAAKPFYWKKDTGGKPVEVFPADPAKAGWKAAD